MAQLGLQPKRDIGEGQPVNMKVKVVNLSDGYFNIMFYLGEHDDVALRDEQRPLMPKMTLSNLFIGAQVFQEDPTHCIGSSLSYPRQTRTITKITIFLLTVSNICSNVVECIERK